MKKNIFYPILAALVALPLMFASCGDRNPSGGGDTQPQDIIVGSWELTNVDVDTDATGLLGEILAGQAPVPAGIIYEFFADGSVYMDVPEAGREYGSYSRAGDKLTITIQGDAQVFDIVELDNRNLTLLIDGLPELMAMRDEIEALLAIYGLEMDLSGITKFDVTQYCERHVEI